MTTKEQERKALEQIKKIVAGLGEDSYIATAFEGCFDLAERNIDEDAAYSMKGRWEFTEKERDAATDKIKEMRKEACEAAKRIEELETRIADMSEKLNDARKERNDAMDTAFRERKEIFIETTDGGCEHDQFAQIQFFNNDGFRFINVVKKSGWTTSYKIDDLKVFTVE